MVDLLVDTVVLVLVLYVVVVAVDVLNVVVVAVVVLYTVVVLLDVETTGLNIDKDEIICLAKKQSNVSLHLNDKSIIKEILVPGRLVNFVVK